MGKQNINTPSAFPIHDVISTLALIKMDTTKNSITTMDSNMKYFLFIWIPFSIYSLRRRTTLSSVIRLGGKIMPSASQRIR